ncbi:MAG: NTP transferase domain-containing protein [Candidatus Zixiibacteriota bacterium]
MSQERAAIVLAAGQGKRMKSDIPKVLHRIHGRPLIAYLLDTLAVMEFTKTIVVIGFKGELVQEALSSYPVTFVRQREQLGTGHAVQMAAPELADFTGATLVALGDVPFLSARSIKRLFDTHEKTGAAATCLTAMLDNPTGYGRVVRVDGSDRLKEIVEEKEAGAPVKKIREINTGLMCFDTRRMFDALEDVDNQNTQQEYYLTDTINILHRKGLRVSVVLADNPDEVLGVNSLEQLAELERKFPSPA